MERASILIKPFIDYYTRIEGSKVDIMLEVKDKNLSALKCIHSVSENTPIKSIEEE